MIQTTYTTVLLKSLDAFAKWFDSLSVAKHVTAHIQVSVRVAQHTDGSALAFSKLMPTQTQ